MKDVVVTPAENEKAAILINTEHLSSADVVSG
jgi:hypothetical protein